MIKVDLREENVITIKGHALFSDFGTDIVCASVSSICITTVNALLSIDEDCVIYEERDGYLKIELKNHNEVIDKLIDNMVNLLKELQKQYNKYIEIR